MIETLPYNLIVETDEILETDVSDEVLLVELWRDDEREHEVIDEMLHILNDEIDEDDCIDIDDDEVDEIIEYDAIDELALCKMLQTVDDDEHDEADTPVLEHTEQIE